MEQHHVCTLTLSSQVLNILFIYSLRLIFDQIYPIICILVYREFYYCVPLPLLMSCKETVTEMLKEMNDRERAGDNNKTKARTR